METQNKLSMIAIMKAIGEVTDETSLISIGKFAFDRAKQLKQAEADKVVWLPEMKVKMKPRYWGSRPFDAEGVIEKVNRVKVHVVFKDGQGIGSTWTVPKTMLDIL